MRARTSDALEFISRRRPDLLNGQLPSLTKLAVSDPVDMVRWHTAMIFANLEYENLQLESVLPILFQMLDDKSTMVKAWTISTLAILGINHPEIKNKIILSLKFLLSSNKPSVSNRTKKALAALEQNSHLPKGWQKKSF